MSLLASTVPASPSAKGGTLVQQLKRAFHDLTEG